MAITVYKIFIYNVNTYMSQQKTQSQQFRELLQEVMDHRPYKHDAHLDRIWLTGFFSELLTYTAHDKIEVKHRLQELRDRWRAK